MIYNNFYKLFPMAPRGYPPDIQECLKCEILNGFWICIFPKVGVYPGFSTPQKPEFGPPGPKMVPPESGKMGRKSGIFAKFCNFGKPKFPGFYSERCEIWREVCKNFNRIIYLLGSPRSPKSPKGHEWSEWGDPSRPESCQNPIPAPSPHSFLVTNAHSFPGDRQDPLHFGTSTPINSPNDLSSHSYQVKLQEHSITYINRSNRSIDACKAIEAFQDKSIQNNK